MMCVVHNSAQTQCTQIRQCTQISLQSVTPSREGVKESRQRKGSKRLNYPLIQLREVVIKNNNTGLFQSPVIEMSAL